MVSRRTFLHLGSIAVAGGLAFGADINVFGQTTEKTRYFPIPANAYSDNLMSLNRQTFEPLLNTAFSFQKKDEDEDLSLTQKDRSPTSLRLVEIVGDEQTKKYLSRTPIDSFTLIFEGAKRRGLGDSIYTVAHPELTQFSMFISTVGRSKIRYQAVFSRVYS